MERGVSVCETSSANRDAVLVHLAGGMSFSDLILSHLSEGDL